MGQDLESLRDLDGVRVAVQDLSPSAAALGLSAPQLQRAVEDQLRQAGITVLGIGDFPVGDPFLRVRADATEESHGVVAYRVDVEFVQMTFMRRNPAVTFNRAQTWFAGSQLGLVDAARARAEVLAKVSEQVDQFVRDYRVVNPKI